MSEGGVAAGVRRIEAITGMGAVAHAEQRAALAAHCGRPARQSRCRGRDHREAAGAEAKKLARDITQLKTRKIAMGGGTGSAGGDDAVVVAGVKLARRKVADLDKGRCAACRPLKAAVQAASW